MEPPRNPAIECSDLPPAKMDGLRGSRLRYSSVNGVTAIPYRTEIHHQMQKCSSKSSKYCDSDRSWSLDRICDLTKPEETMIYPGEHITSQAPLFFFFCKLRSLTTYQHCTDELRPTSTARRDLGNGHCAHRLSRCCLDLPRAVGHLQQDRNSVEGTRIHAHRSEMFWCLTIWLQCAGACGLRSLLREPATGQMA